MRKKEIQQSKDEFEVDAEIFDLTFFVFPVFETCPICFLFQDTVLKKNDMNIPNDEHHVVEKPIWEKCRSQFS